MLCRSSDICYMSDNLCELGIFLLPSDDLTSEIQHLTDDIVIRHKKKGIFFEQDENTPHVTLFQLVMDETKIPDLLEKISHELSVLSLIPQVSLEPILTKVGHNLFWNVERLFENHFLKKAHTNIVHHALSLRSDNVMRQVAQHYKLPPSQRESVDLYGIWWSLPHNYDPHFTVIYDLPDGFDETLIPPLKPQVFKPAFLGIGRLGFQGNVTQVIERLPL